jgi:hypothetical protein
MSDTPEAVVQPSAIAANDGDGTAAIERAVRVPERDARGLWAAGNCGGPGNPHVAKLAEYRAALCETVGREDIVAVVRKLVVLARQGKRWAVVELLDRCLGRPAQAVDVTGQAAGVLLKIVQGVAEDRL